MKERSLQCVFQEHVHVVFHHSALPAFWLVISNSWHQEVKVNKLGNFKWQFGVLYEQNRIDHLARNAVELPNIVMAK